ncbi:MAG: adaptor protein MecA [Lachnospiraceae bacterium]|nr:adaptor protein MecA [Lachnospiraceae bacterium]
MKFYRMNSNTIKCLIPVQDLENHGISLDDMMERKPEAVDFLHEVVDMAADAVGFQEKDKLTSLQIAVVNQDMIVMLASDTEPSLSEAVKTVVSEAESLIGAEIKGKDTAEEIEVTAEEQKTDDFDDTVKKELHYAFSFASMRNLMQFVSFLPCMHMGESALYRERDGSYVLIVSAKGAALTDFGSLYFLASEYGRELSKSQAFISHIMEQKECIFSEQAVEKLKLNNK